MKRFTTRKIILVERELQKMMIKAKGDPNVIFVDIGDELICDYCNADILVDSDDDPIMVIDDHALCKDCEEKSKN